MMSYAGGADCWNVADLLACGMTTITTCSDLLRPGGYARTLQYISETAAAMKAAGAKDLPEFIIAKARAKGWPREVGGAGEPVEVREGGEEEPAVPARHL